VPQLTFLGAARTVTGSKYLLEAGTSRVLVDSGLFQGLRELRRRNWDPLPVDPAAIDAVVLTHAHLDHSGYLPRLVAGGFRGRIFCTPPTQDLCRIILPDAGRLQEEDARQANKHGYSRHQPAEPLFTEADAFRTLQHFQPVGYERPLRIASGIDVEFIDAGHLLGSAFVRTTLAVNGGREILFGGDLGRYGRPILPDPTTVEHADVVLLEATYGDRRHPPDDGGEELARIIDDTVKRGGRLIIPAFAVGRVEEVLYWIRRLEQQRRIGVHPVYVDSPMAAEAMRYYHQRRRELDPEIPANALPTGRFTAVSSTQQSKELMRVNFPCVIISSSGMATGGRVLHHLQHALSDPRNTVLFVGYQAEGTRGRQLLDGATEVKIHGLMVRVAARIAKIDSMSSHADAAEIERWLSGFDAPPTTTFLVHGEPGQLEALKQNIEYRFGWDVRIPDYRESIELI
jgi:metallo-beta-lactamase family protein